MERESTIKFIDGYLEIKMKGEFSLEDYAKVMLSVAEMKDLPKDLKVLGIDNGLVIKASPKDAILLAKFREKTASVFSNVRHATVVKDPKKTALAFLTTSTTTTEHYVSKIFSSKETAIDWLFL